MHMYTHMHTQVLWTDGKKENILWKRETFISLVDILSGDGICYDTSMSMAWDLELDVSQQQ